MKKKKKKRGGSATPLATMRWPATQWQEKKCWVLALGGGQTTHMSHEGDSATRRPAGLWVVRPPSWP